MTKAPQLWFYWPIFPQKYQLVRPTTVSLKPVKMDSLRISPEFIRLTVTSPTRKSYEDLLGQMQTPLLKVKIKTLTSSSFTLHIFSDLKQNKKTLVIKHLLKHLVLFLWIKAWCRRVMKYDIKKCTVLAVTVVFVVCISPALLCISQRRTNSVQSCH